MKAIIELQKRAMDSSTDIVELVRYAYAIAYKLELQEFVDWCNAELEGYSDISAVPNYRVVKGETEVQYLRGWALPLQFNNVMDKEQFSIMPIPYGIIHLVNILNEGGNFVAFSYLPKTEQVLRKNINDRYISHIYLKVMLAEIQKIFGATQKIILDWALKCERQGILGEEWIFTKENKEMAKNITYNINSLQNMANHNTDTTINQSSQNISITKGDFPSLAKFLSDQGIVYEDIKELEKIVVSQPNLAKEGTKNSELQGWMGRIYTKAKNGTIAVASGLTIELFKDGIEEAIRQFF